MDGWIGSQTICTARAPLSGANKIDKKVVQLKIKFSEQVDILGDSSEYLESGAYTVLVELCATLS